MKQFNEQIKLSVYQKKEDEEDTEELGFLEELESNDAKSNDAESNDSYASAVLSPFFEDIKKSGNEFEDIIASFSVTSIPTAIVNEDLNFFYKNPAMQSLVSKLELSGEYNFYNSIGKSLSRDEKEKLYTSIISPNSGHSWNGTISMKNKFTSTIITKVFIIPLVKRSRNIEKPDRWILILDDITSENKSFLRGIFFSLLEASKLKDNDTGKHIERVNLYSELMARTLYKKNLNPEVDADFVENIKFLAAMHDVGKIGTPDDILNKKGPLTEFEWRIMKEHTINGAFILSSYPNPMARQIAQSHHEWWNGTGYPFNLTGTMIPLAARIVAISDVYDALRMKRSYKEPFDHKKASILIDSNSGKHFDPELIAVFNTLESQFEEIFNDNME